MYSGNIAHLQIENVVEMRIVKALLPVSVPCFRRINADFPRANLHLHVVVRRRNFRTIFQRGKLPLDEGFHCCTTEDKCGSAVEYGTGRNTGLKASYNNI
jgi:hypothetical protein